MMKLLLAVFLALALVHQVEPFHSGTETAEVLACVPGQKIQVLCFSSEFDDDQRQDRTLPVALLALPLARVSVFAGRCQDGRKIESRDDRVPLYKLNAVFLI